ncbi:putative porin [Pectinatus sottacetonis]|uniref:putative porin n=1 Tax=Pectinatus sottacetonis TaxID=1002795 RepID=UPI0018C6AABB|nr:putative porin [Pectinatus sottacetonis]
MTKKTLVSMITGALVIGAASTTFAAANPFSDVPAGSWAYDAVSKLASDGVVNGYPDGTYQGQKTMTRYEMAQIVAKAMTKTDVDKADKALVDKLAAEFSEELDNLGVRVSNLEKKSDNVKFTGEFRYRYTGEKFQDGDRQNTNNYLFRLEPKAFIGNTGWVAKARIDYEANARHSNDATSAEVDRLYVEGPLFGATADLGKSPVLSGSTTGIGNGMVIDDRMSGAQFTWGANKDVKVNAGFGKYNNDNRNTTGLLAKDSEYNKVGYDDDQASGDYEGKYGQFEVGYAPKDSKLSAVAGFYTVRKIQSIGKDLGTASGVEALADSKDANQNIWSAGLGYKFDKNVNLYGVYAHGDVDKFDNNGTLSKYLEGQNKAYDVTLAYKGADASKAGSWGMYTAYRYLGMGATIDPTYDGAQRGTKGWEVGANYAVAQNVLATVLYFDGKNIGLDNTDQSADYNKLFGQVEFFF